MIGSLQAGSALLMKWGIIGIFSTDSHEKPMEDARALKAMIAGFVMMSTCLKSRLVSICPDISVT